MPALTTLTVSPASAKAGDLLVHSGVASVVTAVDAKVKWVYVTVEGRKAPLELLRTDEVDVQRMLPTQAEKDAQELAAKLQWYDRKATGARDALAAAQAKLAAVFAKGHLASHWDVEGLLEAQSTWELWARVDHVARVRAMKAVDFDPTANTWTVDALADHPTRLEILEFVREAVREELLTLSHSSRSTSVVSNAADDVARQVKVHFLRYM